MLVKMWICLYQSDIFILIGLVLKIVGIEADNKFTREKNIDTTLTDFNQCAGFECGIPLKQRFSLFDIVENEKHEGVIVFKQITMYRCRPSFGCCRENLTCLAHVRTDHCIKFKYLYHNDDLETDKYIKIKNHISCSCQETVPTTEDLIESKYQMMDECDVG